MDETRSEGGGFRTSDVAAVAGVSPSTCTAITRVITTSSSTYLALKALSDIQLAESSWHPASVAAQLDALTRVKSPAWVPQQLQIAPSGPVQSIIGDARMGKSALAFWLAHKFASLAVEHKVGPLAAPTLGPIAVIDATPRVRTPKFDAAHELRCDLLHCPSQDGSPLIPLTASEIDLGVSGRQKPIEVDARAKTLASIVSWLHAKDSRPFRSRRARSATALVRRVLRMAVVLLRRLLGIQRVRHAETFEAVTHRHTVDQHRTRGPNPARKTLPFMVLFRELAPI
ncbi:hypothetical protein AB0K00_30275 [Dactylosporangium sp. NPDC049525]|uniref:hypothetical protein n=1 Tax=Dactylosporangium sp. NPDC049525 TaxID=3154730 RepID=UPI0034329A96